MEQPAVVIQNGTRLKFLSAADGERAARTFHKLARHDIGRWALTGGLAIECHAPGPSARALNDIDFVAPDFDSIPSSLAGDFLFSHVHPFDPPGKTILQFIDPGTSLRIDVFRACGDTLRRAVILQLGSGPMPVVSIADLLAREARLLLDLAPGNPVPAKHAHDYLRLVELVSPAEVEAAWPDHRRPSHPTRFGEVRGLLRLLISARPDLLIRLQYSQNPYQVCPRCSPGEAFPLADPQLVFALLGYC
jgi:hypothetical protein